MEDGSTEKGECSKAYEMDRKWIYPLECMQLRRLEMKNTKIHRPSLDRVFGIRLVFIKLIDLDFEVFKCG